MQKHVNLADLVKSFPTNIYLQNLSSIQPRTSRSKFDDTNTEDTRFHVGKGLTDLHSAQSSAIKQIQQQMSNTLLSCESERSSRNLNVRHEIRT